MLEQILVLTWVFLQEKTNKQKKTISDKSVLFTCKQVISQVYVPWENPVVLFLCALLIKYI